MKNLCLLVFVSIFALISDPLQASIFIEPQVGHSTGTFTMKVDAPGAFPVGVSINGTSFGGKAGIHIGPLQLGADYMQTKFKLDDAGSETAREYAALLGLRSDWFRLYGEYIFRGEFGGLDGKGMKAGMTFYAFSSLAFSIEYRKITYEKVMAEGYGVDSDYYAVAFLLSFPVEFL